MDADLSIPSGLIVYLVVTGLLQATAHAKAKKNADALGFGPTTMIRWLIVALILGFTGASIYFSVTSPPDLMGIIISGFIALAASFAFPPEILVTDAGVTQVKWWGTKTTIPWKDVSRIEYRKGPVTTVIVGKDGAQIVHGGWNRDTNGFLAFCEKKTGLARKVTQF